MRNHANRLHLPLIPITEPNPYKENKITKTDERFTVQFGGKLYTLKGSPDWQFKSFGQSGFLSFASPEEIEEVFTYLRENNLSEAEIGQFRTEYREADQARQQAKVFYEEQGDVGRIEKTTGYGTGEMRVTVNKYTANRVNVLEQAKKFSAMMADPGRGSMSYDDPYKDTASLHEAEQVVQEAIGNAPDNEKEKLTQWWQSVKGNIATQWENKLRYGRNFSSGFYRMSGSTSYGNPREKSSSTDKLPDLSSFLRKLGLKGEKE